MIYHCALTNVNLNYTNTFVTSQPIMKIFLVFITPRYCINKC